MIGMHASELLGHMEVQQLMSLLSKDSPRLVEELVPKLLSISTVQKVLQNLLSEGVAIRDMQTIMETLLENSKQTQDAAELTSKVRIKLGRAITQQLFPNTNELNVISLDNNLERILIQAINTQTNGNSIEPGIAQTLANEASAAAKKQEQMGFSPVLLVPASLRLTLAKFLRRFTPNLRVLSHEELPESKVVKVNNLIGEIA
jgi:flagellar biosynthesis protein FlhA